MPVPTTRLQITATFTAEPVEESLQFWSQNLGIDLEVQFSGYGQAFQQALNPTSESAVNGRDGINLFLLRLEDLTEEKNLDSVASELVEALCGLAARSEAPLWVMFCPGSQATDETSAREAKIVERLNEAKGVEAVTAEEWQQRYPVLEPFDADAFEAGKIPYTETQFAALGTAIARRLNACRRAPAKVLVLDADNTIWGGVCGEDGVSGVDLEGPWKEVREFAMARKEEGILLCLCSKNQAADVDQVFEVRREELGMSRDDFSGWKANWQPKSENLVALAKELNLGLDSFVFLDDNPVEIAEVEAGCPGVTALRLPQDPAAVTRFLDHLWVLDSRGEITEEDRQRTEFYRSEAARKELGEEAPSFEAFLASLELEVDCHEADLEERPRISQLTRRTNQFNSTAWRFSEEALGELLDSGQARCLAVRVRDRFGDYGLVGAAIYGAESPEDGYLSVDAFLLSCRAMGKGVERIMIEALADRAGERELRGLAIAFSETDRNEPCRRFLESIGAEWTAAEGSFRIELEKAKSLPQAAAAADQGTSSESAASPARTADPDSSSTNSASSSMTGELASRIALKWSDPEWLREVLALIRRDRPDLATAFVKPGTATEKRLAEIWIQVLGLKQVGIEDPFNELGGTSVQLVRVHSAIRRELDASLELTDLFELPTIAAIAKRIEKGNQGASISTQEPEEKAGSNDDDDAVAIVGLALRVPGANSPEGFWDNLAGGVESINRFEKDELAYPEEFDQPGFVPVKGLIEDFDCFDASFFGILPKDAKIMDPQQRIFLELAWEAMERAGYRPDAHRERIGVYAGAYFDTYLLANLCSNRQFLEDLIPQIQVGSLQTELGNDKDYLATRVAFKLNLRGPAMTLQTACSTSMVAIVEACRAIRDGLCDMALAGGVTVTLPLKRGYFYTEQGMLSQDGHCRAFDEKASGTVFGNGAGVVMLKRLSDAVRDRDHIHAVIRGTGMNNDGGVKHSYTAPSVDGQVEVIRMAQRDAGVDPRSISYIEAHGTGTPLGDPIEVSALTRAFREGGVSETGTCALGSLKTNIGHLDVASGVCGVIKTALSLENSQLPPTLHFKKANPKIDFDSNPFYVNTSLTPWAPGFDGGPRRAGVSSFGVGGTNAHVVLEEAPAIESVPSTRPDQLFLLSAKSKDALAAAGENLASFAGAASETERPDPADVAWTLAMGRQPFRHRKAVVAEGLDQLKEVLESKGGSEGLAERSNPPVNFLFPGQGSQHVGMARSFYEAEPQFRSLVDRCSELLRPRLGVELTQILFPDSESESEFEAASERLKHTVLAQPAIFVIEYAMADLWRRWGVAPTAMIGHSVGEFVAACHAGVFRLEEGLELLAERGRLMGELPGGGMLSVRMPADELIARLPEDLDLAAVNGPTLCVVAGSRDRLEAFAQDLEGDEIVAKPLHTSHAFHSRMMDPVVERFAACFDGVLLQPPSIPIFSSVTGEWLTDEQATDPRYWAKHLRETVRFHDAVVGLGGETEEQVFLEVGPGQTLVGLVRQSVDRKAGHVAVSTCRHVKESGSDHAHALDSLGKLWTFGVEVDWEAYFADETRKRVVLPTYPFEKKRHWIEAQPFENSALVAAPLADSPPLEISAPVAAVPASAAPSSELIMNTPESETPTSRLEPLGTAIREILADLSGIPEEEMGGEASFLELGFDSLLLTQVSKSFQNEFETEITMRQLMAEFSTIDAMVSHLDETLPEDRYRPTPAVAAPAPAPEPEPIPAAATTPEPSPVAAVPAANPAASQVPNPNPIPSSMSGMVASGNGAIEALVGQQLELMRQQLALLQGGGNAALPAAAVTPEAREEAPPHVESTPAVVSPPGSDVSAPSTVIHHAASDSLTTRQKDHLDDLIARYTAKTRESKALTARYRRCHADPRTVSGFNPLWKEMVYQIAVKRSKGSRFLDVDGNEYIDLLSGFGPTFLGHSNELIINALHEQLDQGIELGPQSVLAMEAAELFCEVTGNERASFVNTGSEAVQSAMRLARTVTGRDKIVVFAKDYHGNFDEVLVRGVGAGDSRRSLPVAPGIPRRAVEDIIVLPYGSDEALQVIREQASELAAVIIEPIQSRRPELQPREFVREVREITRQSGSLFVFDEVITGFRTGPGGAQEYYGVEADIATYGKVAGGGLPLGVVAGKAEYMDTFDGGSWEYGDDSVPEKGVTFFAGTFVRHPLAMAAVKQVLSYLKDQGPDFWQDIHDRADRLAGTVDRLFVENEVPIRMPNFGSQMFVRVNEEHPYANLLFFHLRNKGVFLLEGFPTYMTAAHTDADIDYVIAAVRESIGELQAAGFFASPASGEVIAIDPAKRLTGPPAQFGDEEIRNASPVSSEVDSDRIHPMTAPLAEIWLASQVSDDASLPFNEINETKFEGPLDPEALRGSLQQIVDRHEALRSSFLSDGSGFRIRSEMTVEMPLIDLSDLDPEAQKSRFEACLREERFHLYDLEQEPLIRSRLIRFSADRHSLLLGAHHIACDGWSFNVINEELSLNYSALRKGDAVSQPAPDPSFTEYVRRRCAEELASEGGADERYWLERYAKPVPALSLPLDRPRSEHREFRSDTTALHLSPEELSRLKKAAAGSGVTLFAWLMGSYLSLLHRIGRQERIAIAFPAAGQNRNGLEDVVGHAVNFVPFVTDLDASESFSGFLGRIQGDLLDAFEHQDFTYGQLLQKLAERQGSGERFFVEAAFNLERLDGYPEFDGLSSSCEEARRTHVTDPLFLKATEGDNGLELRFDFHLSLYERETVQLWLESYVAILKRAMETPDLPLIEIASTVSPDHREWLEERNDTATDYPRTATVPELFREMAERRGEATALRSPAGEISYAALSKDVSRIARAVIEAGGGTGSRVALFLDRSPEMIAGLFGILEAGATYVPLDPEYPEERLQEMLSDSGASLVLTREGFRDRLPAGLEVLVVEEMADSGTEATDCLDSKIGPEDPAYLMYTSGSTGKPKGSLIPHRAIVRLVRDTDYCEFGENEITLQVATVCFDAATYEIFGALLNGGTLVLPAPGPLTLDAITKCLREEGVTQLFLTSGLFQVLVDEDPEALAGVRQILTGGDQASVDHVARLFEALPGCRLINGYGPTENTTFSVCHPMTPSDLERPSIPIGKPIANSTAWILDPDGRLLAPGVPGELCTGGDGVALGYLDRPELTADRFVADPFREGEAEARLYRTGDLARYLPGGTIEFLGRIDQQVKIRGYRVEPGEIEVHLAAHPQVGQAKVVVRGEGAAEKTLVAYVTPSNGAVAAKTLTDYLGARLPKYLVPSAIVVLDSLPLNANGKVDAKALPEPGTEPEQENEFGLEDLLCDEVIEPQSQSQSQTETETSLASLWKGVLRSGEPGLDDDFFAVGGHSLLGMKLFSRIQKTFGVNLTLATLFQASTIRQLAAVIDEKKSDHSAAPDPVAAEREVESTGQANPEAEVPAVEPRESEPARATHHSAQSAEVGLTSPASQDLHLDSAAHQEAREPVAETTVAIQAKGELPPLFGVHGGDGGILFYRDLAFGLVDSGRPFYAFESPALTAGGELPDEPIETTAAHYLAELRKVQPTGPYHLTGYSYGGVVAYHMACLLIEAGEEVAFLGLVDTNNPAESIRKLNLSERVAWNWTVPHEPDVGPLPRFGHLCARVLGGIGYRLFFEFETRAARCLPPAKSAGWLRQVQLRMAHETAMDAYVPPHFPGRLTLFRALTSSDKFDLGNDYGWKDRVDELRIVDIPGEHVKVFDKEYSPSMVKAFRLALPSPKAGETVSSMS